MNKNAKTALNEYREKVKTGVIVKNKKPSMIKAIKKHCAKCCGMYVDGKLDCDVSDCDLYYWMPYSKEKKEQKELKKKLKGELKNEK